MAVDRHKKSNGQGQGMNFVSPKKRIALYLRDGLSCCYCQQTLEDGAKLTLDHLAPHSQTAKPNNHESNLVTCCHKCNSSRGNRCWKEFAAKVADYLNHGITAAQIIAHIETTVQRPLDTQYVAALMARRGNFGQTMASFTE